MEKTGAHLTVNFKLSPSDVELFHYPTLYRQIVDMSTYVTITCPNIASVVRMVSQFMSAPRATCYSAVIRIIRYIHGKLHQGLLLSLIIKPRLTANSDANWVGKIIDHKSATGYLIYFEDSLISWKSKK